MCHAWYDWLLVNRLCVKFCHWIQRQKQNCLVFSSFHFPPAAVNITSALRKMHSQSSDPNTSLCTEMLIPPFFRELSNCTTFLAGNCDDINGWLRNHVVWKTCQSSSKVKAKRCQQIHFRDLCLCRGFQASDLQSLLTVPSMLPFQQHQSILKYCPHSDRKAIESSGARLKARGFTKLDITSLILTFLYWAPQNGSHVVWWSLILMLLTTPAQIACKILATTCGP